MPTHLARSRDETENFLEEQIAHGRKLLEDTGNVIGDGEESYKERTHVIERWDALTAEGLRAMYVDDGPGEEFREAATGYIFRVIGQSDEDTFQYRREGMEAGIHILISLQERLQFAVPAVGGSATTQRSETDGTPTSRGVFVVHGRDEGLRDSVARVLEKLKLDPVILSEQPWRGRTVIEKFEDHSETAKFAVVILSADDWGRGPDDSDWPAGPNRARQNVILELGYFMGRLGRRHVAAMLGPGVAEPSDIRGLGYISLAESNWTLKLGNELVAAGFDVDLNLLS